MVATDLRFEVSALPPGVLLLVVLGVSPHVPGLEALWPRHIDKLVVVTRA